MKDVSFLCNKRRLTLEIHYKDAVRESVNLSLNNLHISHKMITFAGMKVMDYKKGTYKDMSYEQRREFLDACVENDVYPIEFFSDMCRYIEGRCPSVVWFCPEENELDLWCPEQFDSIRFLPSVGAFGVTVMCDQSYDDYVVDFYTFIDDGNLDKVNHNSPDVVHCVYYGNHGFSKRYVSIKNEI